MRDDANDDDDELVGTIIEHKSSHGIDRFKPDSCVMVCGEKVMQIVVWSRYWFDMQPFVI